MLTLVLFIALLSCGLAEDAIGKVSFVIVIACVVIVDARCIRISHSPQYSLATSVALSKLPMLRACHS